MDEVRGLLQNIILEIKEGDVGRTGERSGKILTNNPVGILNYL